MRPSHPEAMQRVIIIGAGGHAQVVADILGLMAAAGAPLRPIGYLDDSPARQGTAPLGLPVLGPVAQLAAIGPDLALVAIGDNRVRRRISEGLMAAGLPLASAIHPSAVLAADVSVGPGCVICARAVVNPGSTVGAGAIINTGSTVDHHNRVGDYAHLAPGVHTGGDVEIGAGAFIGIGATVMPQRRVGAWSVVGAAGLVLRDIPPGVVAVGVPAKVIREQTAER